METSPVSTWMAPTDSDVNVYCIFEISSTVLVLIMQRGREKGEGAEEQLCQVKHLFDTFIIKDIRE